jgi:hypothetical protein
MNSQEHWAAETVIITVYEPDPALWEAGFERRKS